MKWKMLFRIGFTLVILVAILLFYLNNTIYKNDTKDRMSKLVGSDKMAFQESLKNGGHNGVDDAEHHKRAESVVLEHAFNHDRENDDSEHLNKNGLAADQSLDGDKRESSKDNIDADLPKKNGETVETKPPSENVQQEDIQNVAHSGLQPLHHRSGQRVLSQGQMPIHVAVVACGDRADETMVMLKSAVIMTPFIHLVLHVFAERQLHSFFIQQLDFWSPEVLEGLEYRIYDITFPDGENADEWKKLFKPCASQRLFLPTLLTEVDSLIYVDTDILFVSPLSKLWAFFSQFNATQLVALAPEHEDSSVGWYNRFARHPYVPPLGVNSGVMLMNLTRLRQSKWLPSLLEYYKEYRLKITWGDQDLINIYFHYFPEQLYIYPCDWNYRPDHCMYMSVCKPAEQHGAFVLHGCRRVMHNEKQPAFKAVYTAFKEHRFGQDLEFVLLPRLKENLEAVKDTQCGKVAGIFYKQIEEFVAERRRIQENANKIAEGVNAGR